MDDDYTQPLVVGLVAIIILIVVKELLIFAPEHIDFINFYGGGLFGAIVMLLLIMIVTGLRIENEHTQH